MTAAPSEAPGTPGAIRDLVARIASLALALGLFAGASLAGASLAGAQEAAEPSPAELAARVHREGGYADALPIRGARPASGGSEGQAWRRQASESETREAVAPTPRWIPPSWDFGPFGGIVAKLLLYGSLFVLVVFLLYLLSRVRFRDREAELAEAPALAAPAPQPPLAIRWVQGDPDELAMQGRYEEAIAALLIRALRHVGWTPTGKGRSQTAREILGELRAFDARHTPLSEIVTTQELVLFAGIEANRERFLEARSGWSQLALLGPTPGPAKAEPNAETGAPGR